jgi:hypothetical protein
MGTRDIAYSNFFFLYPHPHPKILLYLSRLAMTRSLLRLVLVAPSTLVISLIAFSIAPKASHASLDVLGDPFLNLNSASYDYIDAHGLPVDINEYSWGGYAKKRNTAVRSTAVPATLHHPRRKHAQLLSRQVVVHHPFQSSCFLLISFSLSVLRSRRHVLRTEGVVQIQKFVSTSARSFLCQKTLLGAYN